MGERLTIKAADGFILNAYRGVPGSRPKGGVVVLPEVWGLNNWIRSEVDRYAAEGYLAIAPAVMDRLEFGFESENYGPDHFARVGALMKNFDRGKAMLDVAAAVAAVTAAGKVGVTGYCFGGANSWRAAHAGKTIGVAAASGYYGGGVPNYIDLEPTVPLEMHFGDQDTGIPTDQIAALRQRYPEVPIYLYPAGHGFCNSDGHRYDAASAQQANARTLAFFAAHLA